MATRLVAGRFVRITKLFGTELFAPVWCEITHVPHPDGGSATVAPFLGQEVLQITIGQQPTKFQITAPWDWFAVRTINSLPQYALVAWTKHQLLKEI